MYRIQDLESEKSGDLDEPVDLTVIGWNKKGLDGVDLFGKIGPVMLELADSMIAKGIIQGETTTSPTS